MAESFEVFVALWGAHLLRTAVLLTGDRGEAEDLLQDVLERLYPRWDKVQDPQAYVRTALSRAVTDRWRRAKRRPRQVPLDAHVDEAIDDGANARAVQADVVARLRQLPPRQRAVIVLRYFEDWSEERIAEELDISRGTVKSQASKGLGRLRQLMTTSPDDAPDTLLASKNVPRPSADSRTSPTRGPATGAAVAALPRRSPRQEPQTFPGRDQRLGPDRPPPKPQTKPQSTREWSR